MGTRLIYRKTLTHKKKKAKYTLISRKTYRIPKQDKQNIVIVHTYRKLVRNVNNGTENK